MKSFKEELNFNDNGASTQIILETPFSKEIRILLKKGQTMKEHKAPLPIIIHILEGEIDFGIEGEINHLAEGDILSLESHVKHDLTALKNSIIRLSLSKSDSIDRVKKVAGS
jgi:quercetin dioxygenase-like cupin family protein